MKSPVTYFTDGTVTLYLGDCREILPALGLQAELIVTDPPYGETTLAWDRWVDCWPTLAADYAASMWCFGSMRMFLEHRDEFVFPGWKLSQDVVWRKHNGSSRAADRFRRVHEHALHWYRGRWTDVRHATPRITPGVDPRSRTRPSPSVPSPHLGAYQRRTEWVDDGTRQMPSVIEARSMHKAAIAPTEKPVPLLRPLIEYGCSSGGLVLDMFAGSGSTLEAACGCGRRAVGIEADEAQIEKAARRLSQGVLDLGPGDAT